MTVKIPTRPGPRQDDGFFGPGSLTWEIQGHPMTLLVGAVNGAMYTALSSEVSQAVVDHSKQFTDPYARAQETAYWVVASAFADTAEATRAGKWVQGVHRPVAGRDPVSNTDYSPSRPDLALAGHCLIMDGNIRAFQAYGRTLSDAEIARYWKEGLIIARLLGIDTESPVSFNGAAAVPFPQSYEQWLPIYDTAIAPRLNLSAAARKIIDSTESGFFVPWWGRPAYTAAFSATIEATVAVMRPEARAILGKPRSAWQAAAARTAGRQFGRLLDVPAARDGLERGLLGPRCHELLTEARAIQRRRRAAMPTDVGAA